MPTKVGDALTYKGRTYVVTGIEKHTSQQIAKEDGLQMEINLKQATNVRYLKLEIAHFEEGDYINIFSEYVILQCGQQDTQFIYTYYKVEREQANGQLERQADAHKASNPTSQADDGRSASGTGPGGPRTGEGSNPLHGDGQAGEVWPVGSTRNSS